jgi:hypothetical protein
MDYFREIQIVNLGRALLSDRNIAIDKPYVRSAYRGYDLDMSTPNGGSQPQEIHGSSTIISAPTSPNSRS